MIQRVLRDTGTNLQVSFYQDETLTDPTGNTATVTITRADGTAIVTNGATTRISTGVYSYPLADQANLDYLTVVWQGTFGGLVQTVTDYVEIVGGFYFALAELKAQPNMSAKTTAELSSARRWFETTFENYIGVALVPRYKRVRLSARSTLVLPDYPIRTVRSLRVYTSATDYTAYTADELADLDYANGVLTRRWLGGFTDGTSVIVEYEHGDDAPSQDVREAGLIAARVHLMGDNAGNRMYSVDADSGYGYPTSTRWSPFGLQFADEVANRHRERRAPAVG